MKANYARIAMALTLLGVTAGILSAVYTVWLDTLSLRGFRIMGTSADVSEIKEAISWVVQSHVPDWLNVTNSIVDKLAHYAIYPGLLSVFGVLVLHRNHFINDTRRFVATAVLTGLSILGILLVYQARSLDQEATGRFYSFMTDILIEDSPDESRGEVEKKLEIQLQHHRDQLKYAWMSLLGFATVGVASWGFTRTSRAR